MPNSFRRAALRTVGLALLVTGGCVASRTPRSPVDRSPVTTELEPADKVLAEALAHFAHALVLTQESDDGDAALAEFARAVELDPDRSELALRLAHLYLQDNRGDEAVAALDRLTARNPEQYQPWILKGLIHQSTGNVAAAAAAYDGALKADATKPHAYAALSALSINRDDPAGAMRVLDRGWKRVSERRLLVPAYEHVALAFIKAEEYDDARLCLERVIGLRPEAINVRHLLALVCEKAGRRDRANAVRAEIVGLLKERSAALPETERPYLEIAETCEQMGDVDAAIAHYELAASHGPASAQPFLRLAALYLPHRTDKALDALRNGIKAFPNEPSFYAFLGVLHNVTGKYDEAVKAFEKAGSLLGSDPGDEREIRPSFYFWYGSACERLGRYDKAEELLEQCIAADPDNHEARNYLAYMWAERGVKLERALEYVNRALQSEPDNGAYVDTLAWVLYRQGRYPEALRHIKRAERLVPDDPTITQHVGDVLKALGRTEAAVSCWKRSFRLDPDNRTVVETLQSEGVDIEALRRETKPAQARP